MTFLTVIFLSIVSFSASAENAATDPLFYNKKVVQFIQDNLGKKIYEGESVDLPLEALKAAGAKWKYPTEKEFGIEVKNSEIEAGDILKFDRAEFGDPKAIGGWRFDDNTLVVFKIDKKLNIVEFATQNFMDKKFVTLHSLELNTLRRGKYIVFRPQSESGPATPAEDVKPEEKKQ